MLKKLIREAEESITAAALDILRFTALFADILLLGCALCLLGGAWAVPLPVPAQELFSVAEELFSLVGRIIALGAIFAFAADIVVRRQL